MTWGLSQRHAGTVRAVDIVDSRRKELPHFELFDGIRIPAPDQSCDVVLLNFVLHHVPDATKPELVPACGCADHHRMT